FDAYAISIRPVMRVSRYYGSRRSIKNPVRHRSKIFPVPDDPGRSSSVLTSVIHPEDPSG
ncbi:MAG: hypothetical protein WC406_05650, partial [Methanoregula sp.]